ncbi:PREDICTED: golgin subfamily A member 7 [Charadrius vociferus]|uniref:golgin subfamily A member 7 n=1 Tax=Charadrius vociferus TaxID=50402 RepID=UPI0005215288|nr:PREDICTED: golgin subfamily A member 7 [Charadrius vociferus]
MAQRREGHGKSIERVILQLETLQADRDPGVSPACNVKVLDEARPKRTALLCLQPHIDRQQFEETVRTLNNLYAEAEKLGGQSYLEGCLACLTAYTIFLCMETHYEKVLKKIAKFIQEQNEKIYAPQGLLLTDPIERGLRVIEITIYEDRGMTSGR